MADSRSNTSAAKAPSPYRVAISPRFAAVSFLSASLVCFVLGCGARRALLHQQQQYSRSLNFKTDTPVSLPPLFVAPHKPVPHTRYTSKHYDTGLSIGSDTLLSHRPTVATSKPEPKNDTLDELEIHEPAGQHLLIDIEHVDGAFLNSEHHLAQAMIDLVDISGLTMLSYHCHKLLPAGVSCAGVLLESHVSFHTWPVQGVITLDLFTCGPNSLLNLLGDVKSLFAIPESDPAQYKQEPNLIWAFKRRGFPTDEGYTPGISDLGTTLLGVLQFPRKEQVSFFRTPFQQVHIYNVLDPRYSKDTMERRMYLDGVLQARQRGQAAYSEAFVHPALLTHTMPQKVTIVGGGDGATLREVLKHASIQRVEMVEIDEAVADISQKWLWSQCDDFLPVSNCREDPRVELYYQDGFEWFQKRYGRSSAIKDHQDVIILDVLNPEDNVDFSEVFYDDLDFAQNLYGALAEDGILAVKLGPGRSLDDPPERWTRAHHVAQLVANLEEVGFISIHEYEDSHGGMLESETSSFLVALKSPVSQKEWSAFANEALVQVKLQERLMRTKTGRLPLMYVDAATLQSYQMPSRTSEVMFCRNQEAKNLGQSNNCEFGLHPRQKLDLETMDTCVNEMRFQEASAVLMKERFGRASLGSGDSIERHPMEAYNPFYTRNAFVNECVSKSAMGEPSAVMTAASLIKEADNQDDNDIPSYKSLHPNQTTTSAEDACPADLFKERECTTEVTVASATAAIYENASV